MRMNGWDGLLAGNFTVLPSISSTFRSVSSVSIMYVSTWRPFDLIDEPYNRAREAVLALQEDFESLHQVMLDYMVYIAINNTYNSYIINNRVHDSGWGDRSVGTMFKPWDVWVDYPGAMIFE